MSCKLRWLEVTASPSDIYIEDCGPVFAAGESGEYLFNRYIAYINQPDPRLAHHTAESFTEYVRNTPSHPLHNRLPSGTEEGGE